MVERKQALRDLVDLPPSIVRTFVPIVINGMTMLGLGKVIENDALWTVSSAVVALGYYVTVRLLEIFVNPKFGTLILSRSRPQYAKTLNDNPDGPVTQAVTTTTMTTESKQAMSPQFNESKIATDEFVGEIPEGFGFLLQEGRSDDEYNRGIGADDAEWMETQQPVRQAVSESGMLTGTD